MVLPIVPLAIVITSSLTGSAGLFFGAQGGVQIRDANKQIGLHSARYEKRKVLHLAQADRTDAVLQAFGQTQERAERDVIVRMEDFLVRQGMQVRTKERPILDGVDGSNTHVRERPTIYPDVVGWVGSLGGPVAASAATRVALLAAAKEFARASTGTRIKTLNGAAAERAILAFFGGGSYVSGGGGMELGGLMLNVAGAGVSLLGAGVTVKMHGTKALSQAEEHRTNVDVAIAQLDVQDELHRGVQEWGREQDGVLSHLVSQATEAIDVLESEPFDSTSELHAKRLLVAFTLVKAVGQVISVPAVGEDGSLDGTTEQLTFRYRDTTTEATDD
ncbi:hypothetical protein PV768_19960 [Pseudarthrobacter sp. CC4]|uniref:hypothetical protein n=1 Tax=Pseudarthrobacter TaxID=1742993 RepID=UPI002AA827F9|nr:hypothetical protein [Pseudarthrobacter oxydans]WPU07788.1 hypothetical protein SMD14_11350 [Pseudarthrobacter oxydans]